VSPDTPSSGQGRPKPTKAPWRRAADYAERAMGDRIEPLVQRRDFAVGLSIAKKADMRVRGLLAAQTRRLLHTLNMPTRADIRRLHEHLDAVDAHVSEVVREQGARDATPATVESPDGGDARSDLAETGLGHVPDA
jgi:hypothetical protein